MMKSIFKMFYFPNELPNKKLIQLVFRDPESDQRSVLSVIVRGDKISVVHPPDLATEAFFLAMWLSEGDDRVITVERSEDTWFYHAFSC